MDIEVPSRVVFLNAKDGNAFFDCSPAEARIATSVIKHMRSEGEGNADYFVKFSTSIREKTAIALRAPVTREMTVAAVTANLVADCFCELEKNNARVSHTFMNAMEYAWLRKFDRDVLDDVTEAWMLRSGVMAYMWGSYIVVTPELHESIVFGAMDDGDNPQFHHVKLTYDDACEDYRPVQMDAPPSASDIMVKLKQMAEAQALMLNDLHRLKLRCRRVDSEDGFVVPCESAEGDTEG